MTRLGFRRNASNAGLALLIVLALTAGCTAVPAGSPTVSDSPQSSNATATPLDSPPPSAAPVSLHPYRLSIEGPGQTPGPTVTISTTVDCGGLPSAWIQSFCSLTLRSDWQAIIGPTDPLVEPPDGSESATWFASLARAEINGDTSICTDVAMRFWLSAGSGLGGAPLPGSTPTPVHPVAICLRDLRSMVAQGSLTVTGPPYKVSAQEWGMDTVRVFVDPAAASHVTAGSAPSFDPFVACDMATLTRATCGQLIDAVTLALGSRQGKVASLLAYGHPYGCLTSASPCAPPDGGRWLGSVLASIGDKTGFAFDVADVAGQIRVSEVPVN